MTTRQDPYHARMKRVLSYIDRHLEDDLGLDTLSAVAALSKYHFHRQFRGYFGISVHRYVQLVRMKRAGQVLAFKDEASVTETALDVGYDAPDAFARAFRKSFGQLPSAFRDTPDWEVWFASLWPLTNARSKLMKTAYSLADVNIVDVPETPVAVLQHRGNPALVAEAIQKFIAWRRAVGLSAASSATYNVFHSDSDITPPDEFRLDICAATDRKIELNVQGVEAGVLPAGRCAVLRAIGAENVEPAIEFLYRDWLPASGEALRDFPLYCQRVSFVPMVAEHEAITDIFLPLV
ncbi:MAG: helix-turn-helix domain-containing protein [Mesorhizobium sp.]|uniref:AraC family transcriptional regulator n=1 Tax=Mesorhizobium sp. TaxID=1871066 RepID=UPI000FE39C2A|nr:AraC family transcriptional regulator [Mesorhizobium sp.]RWO29376.1 MAG: helix-turn-helix domain-containing protein [Mesorhizobium sp.]RWO39667.1 MAG: helix-turn-helix domain-containing protein [Mesorhizobium sp.]TIN79875.1 MAG: helix-turn-helix domain-containing protein [Mesorhizobium sp.]